MLTGKFNKKCRGTPTGLDCRPAIQRAGAQVTKESPAPAQSFADWLRDGRVLCALANAIRPGVVPKVNDSPRGLRGRQHGGFHGR